MVGKFVGIVKTEWLTDVQRGDRDMRLLEDFTYVDGTGQEWKAPAGSVINGASIPRALWSTVGSPYTDNYRRASVIHDAACGQAHLDRKEVDHMFYWACRAGGCDWLQARTLYIGVRIGAWSASSLTDESMSRDNVLFRTSSDLPIPEYGFVKQKLQDVHEAMSHLSEEATLDDFDAIIDAKVKPVRVTAIAIPAGCSLSNPEARVALVQRAVIAALATLAGPGATITLGTRLGASGLGHTDLIRMKYLARIQAELNKTPNCMALGLTPASLAIASQKFVRDIVATVLAALN